MTTVIVGILGVVLGFFIFSLLFRLANNTSYRKWKKKVSGTAKKYRPNFTKVVLIAVLITYFIGLYVGIRIVLVEYSEFGSLATYIAAPTTTVIALYCWKAKAENIIKLKQGFPKETEGNSVDLNNINI